MNHDSKMVKVTEAFKRLPEDQQMQTLIEYLGSPSPFRVEFAQWCFGRMGESIVPMLVREAVLHQRRPRHCVRILDMIEKIGAQLSASTWVEALSLAGGKHQVVKEKAVDLLRTLGHAKADAGKAETTVTGTTATPMARAVGDPGTIPGPKADPAPLGQPNGSRPGHPLTSATELTEPGAST